MSFNDIWKRIQKKQEKKGKNSFKFEPQILPKETMLKIDTPLPSVLASV